MCILPNSHVLVDWMPKAKDTGMCLLSPQLAPWLHSPPSMGSVRKGGGRRGETKWKRERLLLLTAETTVFVSQHRGGTRATNVKQTKTRGTSVHRRTHTLMHFPLLRLRNKKAIVGSWRMEKQTYKQTIQLCACVPLHACMHASTEIRTMEADRLWLVPLQ